MCLTTAPNVYSICHIDPQYLHFATHTTQVIIYAERGNGSMTFAFSVTLCLQPSSYQSSFHFVFWQQTSQTLLLVLWPLTPLSVNLAEPKAVLKKALATLWVSWDYKGLLWILKWQVLTSFCFLFTSFCTMIKQG